MIQEWREPIAQVNFIIPTDSIGPVMKLCQDRRGKYKKTEYLSKDRTILVYELPLGEIILDVHDRLKSMTRGYGTMDYEILGFAAADLCKLDVLVAGDKVDALSTICHREQAERRGRKLALKLKQEIDRHMFQIAIQAAIGGKVVARETISAMRKNVTAKCYGGDVTRKRKLLEKQKEGKKRMKQVGRVEIPQGAFLAILGVDDE
jgi:GTP-binding protein LepA